MAYLPPLSSKLRVDFLPDIVSNISGGVNNLIDKIKLKEFQAVYNNETYSYYAILRTEKRVEFDLFGTGIKIILNPSFDENNPGDYTDMPINLSYKFPVKDYLSNFNISNFSGSFSDSFKFLTDILNIEENELIENLINSVLPSNSLEDFIDQINQNYSLSAPLSVTITGDLYIDINSLIDAIDESTELENQGIDIYQIIIDLFILQQQSPFSPSEFIEKCLDRFLNGDTPLEFLKKILIPEIDFSTTVTAGIEFPRTLFIPVKVNGEMEEDENIKMILICEVGTLRFSTDGFFGFTQSISLSFPSTYPQASILKTGIKIGFTNAKLDLSREKNIPEATADGRPDDFIGVYVQEASISLPNYFNEDPNSSSAIIRGRNLLIGTGGFSGTIGLEAKTADDPSPLIKANFGGGFSVSLDAFDITFQQNAIISSNIHGTMKIPGFKDTTGADAEIHIDAWIGTNGEFSVTASEDQGITALRIPDILDVTIKSLSIGRKGGRFFVAVSGAIKFADLPAPIGQFLPDAIEVQKLLIWQDGQMEYEGGTLVLPNAISLKVGPVELSVTAIGLGSYQQIHNGIERKYKFFEFSGGININPGGIDARGDGIKFYYTVDDDPNAGRNPHRYIRIQGISIDLIIPGSSSPDKAALLLKGYLAMKDPKPGNEQAGEEYAGGITFSLPRLKMSGSASMRLNPKVPAFIVDTDLELSNPILLGSTGLGIYGFRGLLGQRYKINQK